MTRPLRSRVPVALAELGAGDHLQLAATAEGSSGGVELALVALDGAGAARWVVSPSAAPTAVAAATVLGSRAAARFALDLAAVDAHVAEIHLVVRGSEPGSDPSGEQGSSASPVRGGHGDVACTVEADGVGLATFSVPPAAMPAGSASLVLVLPRRDGWHLLPVGAVGDDPVAAAAQREATRPAARRGAAPADPAPPPIPVQQRDRPVQVRRAELDELLATTAPDLLDAARTADETLDQAGLGGHTARVALCLDMSYSMMRLYSSGRIQRFADKVLAMATRLSPDGRVGVFQFGTTASYVSDLEIANRNGYVNLLLSGVELQKATLYGRAMAAIRLHYFGDAGPRTEPWAAEQPVYVMFLTDGETYDPERTRAQAHWSAYEPVFWQFMAVGASRESLTGKGPFSRVRSLFAPSFELLHELDDLEGRFLNNADFFSVDEPDALSDDELFAAMMHEYPGWVAAAWERRLLGPPSVSGR